MAEKVLGVRMVTEDTVEKPMPHSTLKTILFAGDRSRPGVESIGMSAYEIQRRDLKTTFRVFPQKRHYQRIPILEMLTTEELAKSRVQDDIGMRDMGESQHNQPRETTGSSLSIMRFLIRQRCLAALPGDGR